MSWTTPKTWIAGELVTATQMNTHLRDNLVALKAPPTQQVVRDNNASYTTTSTTFVDVDSTNLSIMLPTEGGDVLLWATASVVGASGVFYYLTFNVDGADEGLPGGLVVGIVGSGVLPMSLVYLKMGLSAGNHTFKLRWRVSSGTGIMYAGVAGTGDVPVVFGAREIS